MISNLLKNHQSSIYPILGESFQKEDFCNVHLDLNHPHLDLDTIQTYEGLDKYIRQTLKENNAKIGIGGYLEKRVLYQQSSNFKNTSENRNIHLGIDWWSEAGTAIHAPLDAIVHSFQYNAAHLDYGATIILQHDLEGLVFYTLYGHLTLASLNNLTKGKPIAKGTVFTAMGKRHENGGWVPHLHFQIIQDMLGKEGDFPGVASEKNLLAFSKNCPDPNVFFIY